MSENVRFWYCTVKLVGNSFAPGEYLHVTVAVLAFSVDTETTGCPGFSKKKKRKKTGMLKQTLN